MTLPPQKRYCAEAQSAQSRSAWKESVWQWRTLQGYLRWGEADAIDKSAACNTQKQRPDFHEAVCPIVTNTKQMD